MSAKQDKRPPVERGVKNVRPELEGHESQTCPCDHCKLRRAELGIQRRDRAHAVLYVRRKRDTEEKLATPSPPPWMLDPSLLPKRPPGK